MIDFPAEVHLLRPDVWWYPDHLNSAALLLFLFFKAQLRADKAAASPSFSLSFSPSFSLFLPVIAGICSRYVLIQTLFALGFLSVDLHYNV